jgi:hypothetical protein
VLVAAHAPGDRVRRVFASRVHSALLLLALTASCRSVPVTDGTERMPDSVPRGAWRFAITSTTDSTVAFSARDAAWLRSGMTGYAVDPARRDAFVANLAIMSAQRGEFNALVTGQLRPVDSSHVVVVVRPALPFWRATYFWTGLVTGAVAATGTALIAK